MAQMYKVFIKANLLLVSDVPVKSYAGYKKVVNIEYSTDEVFTNMIPTLEVEYAEPVCYCLHGPNLVYLWRRFRKQYKLVIAGGGLVRNGKNKILFIYRNKRWDLPKGKAEYAELIEETALREVKEECGLTNLIVIKHIIDTYHTYDLKGSRKLKKTSWYLMHSNDVELVPQLEEGITKIKWVKEEKLDKIYQNTYPSIMEVVEAERRQHKVEPVSKPSHKNMSFE
jgi:8-oxo-dGTP pyrophosphatase MutT (NUDIX family)